jgi:thioredoxin reductase (NADPH)
MASSPARDPATGDGARPTRPSRPVILAVDDEPAVLRAVQRDLRRRFGERYRVLRAGSGAEGLELLDELVRRGEAIAALVADQRMPVMSGVDFLEAAADRAPDARTVLLTAYADTDAAIRAINEVQLDHYLLKPWDPPEERLYPVIDDLLADWSATAGRGTPGLRIIGHRWSRESHALRDILTRNQLPLRWLDIENDEEATRLLRASGLNGDRLPVIVLDDGEALAAPEPAELAERLGFSTHAEQPFYDIVIVGGGPAGLAAAVYGASEGLRTLMVEREAPGGQAGQSSRIENYLGFPNGLSGSDLARRASAQARRFGAEFLAVQEARGIEARGAARVVHLSDGSEIGAHAILVATGVTYRRLDAPGVADLTGRGVYYGAAMTEALTCKGQDVVIVGGANSAGQAAVYFSSYARRVHVLVRGGSLEAGMSQYLVDQLHRLENVDIHLETEVAGVEGDDHLDRVRTMGKDGAEMVLGAAALFIFIGAAPRTDWLGDLVRRDDRGFILAGPDLLHDGRPPRGWPLERDPYLLETSTPGVFVAGDVRHDSIKRVASAVGEGAMAVQSVHGYMAGR